MQLRHLTVALVFCIALACLPGCNFLERNSFGLLSRNEPTQNAQPHESFQSQNYQHAASSRHASKETTKVAIEPRPSIAPPKKERIEVIWEIPASPVDGYILKYGPTPENLSNSVEVQTATIEQINDPTHGKVYRYVLRNVPTEQKLFVSMASKKDGIASPFSAPFQVGE